MKQRVSRRCTLTQFQTEEKGVRETEVWTIKHLSKSVSLHSMFEEEGLRDTQWMRIENLNGEQVREVLVNRTWRPTISSFNSKKDKGRSPRHKRFRKFVYKRFKCYKGVLFLANDEIRKSKVIQWWFEMLGSREPSLNPRLFLGWHIARLLKRWKSCIGKQDSCIQFSDRQRCAVHGRSHQEMRLSTTTWPWSNSYWYLLEEAYITVVIVRKHESIMHQTRLKDNSNMTQTRNLWMHDSRYTNGESRMCR